MPSRKSSRNENKKGETVSDLEEKSEMEMELQILELESTKASKIQKKKSDVLHVKKVKKSGKWIRQKYCYYLV